MGKLLWRQFCAGGKRNAWKILWSKQISCHVEFLGIHNDFAKCQKNEQVFTNTSNWSTQVNVSTFRKRHTDSNGNNVTIHSMWCDRNSDDWNWLKCDVVCVFYLCTTFYVVVFFRHFCGFFHLNRNEFIDESPVQCFMDCCFSIVRCIGRVHCSTHKSTRSLARPAYALLGTITLTAQYNCGDNQYVQ